MDVIISSCSTLDVSSAWWGFSTAADQQRLNAFVRRALRAGRYTCLLVITVMAVIPRSPRTRTCTRTCTLMSGETAALNAHILSPELVKSVFEGVGRLCFDDILKRSIPVRHHSLVEESSTNATCISRQRQF